MIDVFYSRDMVSIGANLSPSAGKPAAVAGALSMAGIPVRFLAPVPLATEDFHLAHDPDYVADVLKLRDAGVSSIALRLRLMDRAKGDETQLALETVSTGGHDLYDSANEMIEANEALGRCSKCGRYKSDDGKCPDGHRTKGKRHARTA